MGAKHWINSSLIKPIDKEKIYEGEDFEIITDKSPFYAEKGGQIGDTGKGFSETGEFEIIDTTSPYGGVFIHKSKMKSGEINSLDFI